MQRGRRRSRQGLRGIHVKASRQRPAGRQMARQRRTEKRKVLITGCGGMLGSAFHEVFANNWEVRATDLVPNEPWLGALDVRDVHALRRVIADDPPDYVIHLAALTDLEFCETHPEETYATNTLGTMQVALLAKEFDLTMVYVSSAGVFDGSKAVCDDDDRPNPLNHYGRSKYLGELFVQQYLTKYFILRGGWMMGGGAKDRKFVSRIMQQIRAGRSELFAVGDLFGSPTYTYNFATNVAALLTTTSYGTYNLGGRGGASRYDIAKEILIILGLERRVTLHKVTREHFAKEFFAPRPISERLANRKLTAKGLDRMEHWRSCLREYLSTYH